nr:hypothetical protein [Tanacetum cinerariifolium]
MDMRLRGSFKDYKDSCEKLRIQVFYKEILNQYHPVSSSFISTNKCLKSTFRFKFKVKDFVQDLVKIQVAQKKVKIAFENVDSSLRVELIPSKIKLSRFVYGASTQEIGQQTFIRSISMKWPLHLQSVSWLVLLPLRTSCPSCEQEKSKRASHPPKPVPISRQRLHLLHMDLCGPMRIASINGKRVGISHQVSSVRTPQQNEVVERRNRTLVEAARTMLIFSHASLFLWAEAIATACFNQNRSIIHRHFNKTPYELINDRKPDISFLHVFGALCYPMNDREDIRKLGAKGDISFFIGYSADSCSYRVFNQRTKKIIKTMNVSFDELLAMAFEQRSSKPGLQSMTSRQISSGLDLTYVSSTVTNLQPTEGEFDLLFEAMYDDYIGGQPSATARTAPAAQAPQVRQTSTTSTSIADITPTPTNSSSQATNFPNTSQDVDELNSQQQHV